MSARAALKLASSLPATESGAKGKMHMSVVRTLGARILGANLIPVMHFRVKQNWLSPSA